MAKASSQPQSAEGVIDAMTTAPVPERQASPDNTPIPGGGRWAWDDVAGQWVSRDLPTDQPPQE